MFQGNNCHPISPAEGVKIKADKGEVQLGIDENDQIFKITSKIDIKPKEDFSYLSDDQQKEYMQNILNLTEKSKSIKEKFSETSPELVEILD